MRRLFLLPTVALVLAVVTQAGAEPITYTFQAVATGTLGQTAYTNALVTLTFKGDTNDVVLVGGISQISVGTATVTVATIGTATFTDKMAVTDVQSLNQVGLTDLNNSNDVLDVLGSAFATYQLNTSIGPISTETPFWEQETGYNTTRGAFVINFVPGNATFAAVAASTIPGPVPTVPPSTPVNQIPTLSEWVMILLAILLALVGAAVLRRSASARPVR
jgi:hypothetical protein